MTLIYLLTSLFGLLFPSVLQGSITDMYRGWLLFFLPVLTAKLHYKETTTTCMVNSRFYWNIFAAHFSDASLVTINILHDDDHHDTMNNLVDLVFKYAHVFTKLLKPICVKHTPLSGIQNSGDFLEGVDGRSAYILIVWDHIILSNFLDLIPDEVVRDRRGKYLILFAYNIPQFCFEYNAHVLAQFWKRFGIVNVCVHVPCSCRANKIDYYHPFLQKINTIDIVQLSEKPASLTISLKNLHQYPLKVSMFQRQPTAIKTGNLYSGVDGLIMQTLSNYLNFLLVYVETDYYKYGKVLANGTAVGSLGDVVYRRVHIAGNGRFMEDSGTDAVEFSLPYQNDFMCFIVPKSQKIPQWIMLFHCFTLLTWMVFVAMFAVSALIWKALRGEYFAFYAVCINNPLIVTFNHKQKLFLFFYLSYNLILTGIFQGSVTTSFSTISYYSDIKTLEALVKSGLTISSNIDVFKDDNHSLAAILKSRQQPTNGERALQRAAIQQDVAGIERRLDAIYYIHKQFLNENGIPLVHIVDECVTSYFIAFVVPKGSPFLIQFNYVINMLNEAGLPKKWYEDVAATVIFRSRATALRSNDEKKALSINDVQTAFYFLVLGLSFAYCVFLVEIWIKRRERSMFSFKNEKRLYRV